MSIQVSTVLTLLGLLFGVTAYSVDWQKEQDDKLAKQNTKIVELNMMIEQQKEIIKLQQETHRQELKMRGIHMNPEILYKLRDVQ